MATQHRRRLLTRVIWVIALSLLSGEPVRAQVGVIDVSSIQQQIVQYALMAKDYAAQLEQIAQQYQQIQNQVQQIQHAYEQVKHGVTNLTRLDLNYAAGLLGINTVVQGKLNQASYLSYQLNQVEGQLQQIYGQVGTITTEDEAYAALRRWGGAQREAATVAAHVQAIQQERESMSQRLSEALTKATAAQGNLDISQAQAQIQGLQTAQLQQVIDQLATSGRLQSTMALREQAREEAAISLQQQLAAPDAGWTAYQPQGRLIRIGRVRP